MNSTVASSGFLCIVLWLTGCGGGLAAGPANSITGGVAIWMKTTDHHSSHALYIVQPDGTLAFGGGYTATRDETDWEEALTTEEAASLRVALDEAGWFRGPPTVQPTSSGHEVDSYAHEIRFAWPGGSWKLKAEHGGGGVSPVRELLRGLVSQKRHRELFDQLPEARPR